MSTIERIGTTTRWSDLVIHNGTVYVVEVPVTLDADIHQQSLEVLNSLEQLLLQAGSSKAHILMATIYLQDIQDIAAFNAVWDTWLPRDTAPVRACVQARLAHAEYKVEIQLTAATC
ncbi:MAG: RidA family protein [Plesiomonas sp.]|uniref:RidA family protein n=1 Tax=Plesiomonas sp. TaxID=2486279 RepID=UPI003F343E30